MSKLNAIRLLLLFALSALALPVHAQAEEGMAIAEVGHGAPRSTLAYVIANPQQLLEIAGWDGEKFFWMPQQPEAPEGMPEGKGEEEGMGPPPNPMDAIMEWAKPILMIAKRVDVAVVDITLGGAPKMYLDITLGADAKVDLKPEFLAQQFEVTDAEFSGVDVVRYAMPEPEHPEDMPEEEREMMGPPPGPSLPPTYAFQRMGHLYIAMYESVITDLARGLAKGPSGEGENLSELSRFTEWYNARKDGTLQLWMNIYEIRRLIEQAEGVDEGMQDAWQQVNDTLDIRSWRQFTMGFDFKKSEQTLSMDLQIVSRRDIEAFTSFAATGEGYVTRKYVPQDTVMIAAAHMPEPIDMWPALEKEMREVMEKMAAQEERQRERRRRWEGEEKRSEDFPEEEETKPEKEGFAPPAGGEVKGEGPGKEDRPNPLDEGMEMFREHLQRAGLSFEDFLKLLGTEMLIGMPTPEAGTEPVEEVPVFLVASITDAEKAVEVIRSYFASMHAEGEEEAREMFKEFQFHGGKIGFSFAEMFQVHVAPDALLLSICERPEAGRAQLVKMLQAGTETTASRGVRQLLQMTNSMIMGVDVHGIMQAIDREKRVESQSLLVEARPYTSAGLSKMVPEGMSFAMSATATSKSLGMRWMVTQFQPRSFIEGAMEMGQGSSDPYEAYVEGQLNELNRIITREYTWNEKEVPNSIEQIIEETEARYAHVQSPFDSRFVRADSDRSYVWFPSGYDLEEEVEEGFEDPIVEAAKANEKKKFVSYTLVEKAKWGVFEGQHIVAYQTSPDYHGGRWVLYSDGQVGWLHDSVWKQAMEMTKSGKPIPSKWEMEYAEEGRKPEEKEEDGEGEKK